MVLTKICMPPQRCLPNLGSNVVVGGVWNPWDQGWLALLVLGKLPWQSSCRGCPATVFPGRSTSPLCSFMLLALASPCLSCASISFRLPSSSLLSVAAGAALTARPQVKGLKGEPLILYTDRSPRAWATHKRDTLLGQAQNGARAGGPDFYCGNFFARLRFPTTRVERATWGSCVTWGACVGRFLPSCVTSR